MNEFETKDSGERLQFSSGMVRDINSDKTRWGLLMPLNHPGKSMLQRWAELLTRGARKYEARNWEKASSEEEYLRFKESAANHFFKWWFGLEPEEDHAAAVFFNIEGAEYTKGRML
jgi:hypothetical protein